MCVKLKLVTDVDGCLSIIIIIVYTYIVSFTLVHLLCSLYDWLFIYYETGWKVYYCKFCLYSNLPELSQEFHWTCIQLSFSSNERVWKLGSLITDYCQLCLCVLAQISLITITHGWPPSWERLLQDAAWGALKEPFIPHCVNDLVQCLVQTYSTMNLLVLFFAECASACQNAGKWHVSVQFLSSRRWLQFVWRKGWFWTVCAPGMAASAWYPGTKSQRTRQ